MQCPMCPGDGQYVGQLGRLVWFRCRNCGRVFGERACRLPAEIEMALLERKYEND